MKSSARMLAALAIALLATSSACGARTPLLEGDAVASGANDAGTNGIVGSASTRTISASWSHTCAITSDRGVVCWGESTGIGPAKTSPTPIAGLADVVEIAAGQVLDCARTKDGAIHCWGPLTRGQVTKVAGTVFSRIVAGSASACGIDETGGVSCVGAPFVDHGACENMGGVGDLASAHREPGLGVVADVSVGQRQACAFDASGNTSCWGCVNDGAPEEAWSLGSMSGTSAAPLAVPGVNATVLLASETESTCAVQRDGRTLCWGEASQFGPGITIRPSGPIEAGFPANPIDLDVGVTFSCAATKDTVTCIGGHPTWADGCKDRVDDPITFALPGVTEISVGLEHVCARDGAGAVWCWGCNSSGEVGDGTKSARATPVRVL